MNKSNLEIELVTRFKSIPLAKILIEEITEKLDLVEDHDRVEKMLNRIDTHKPNDLEGIRNIIEGV